MNSLERHEEWDRFLKRWPLESLASMTLSDFTALGSRDSFCAWVDSQAKDLGASNSMKTKYGIFEYNPDKVKSSSRGTCRDDRYAWFKKYGKSAEEAFETIKSAILRIATAAAQGNFALIDGIDLGPVVKWKIAFLYQDRKNPHLVCIYKDDALRLLTSCDRKAARSSMYEKLDKSKPANRDIFDYADDLWIAYENQTK